MKFNIGGIMLQKSILCVLLLVVASMLISCPAKKLASDSEILVYDLEGLETDSASNLEEPAPNSENNVPYSFKLEISNIYRNTDNVRLRQGESNTTRPLFTLPKNTPIQILAQGKEETIDGITANWMQVGVLVDTVSTENIQVKKSTTGWFFNDNAKSILQEIEETYRTTLNLRLRQNEGSTGTPLFTLPNDTPVKILAKGNKETINGITANWVQIVLSVDTSSIQGDEIKSGTVGWCFSGYLAKQKTQ